MDEQNFIYGCKSGIQKGIRRGDLDLVRTCFDALWTDKTNRQWLKWRLPVLVVEEAWYMIGETAEFLLNEPENDIDWRREYYRLAIAPKCKDACGLMTVARGTNGRYSDHGEIQTAEFWQPLIDGGDLPKVARELSADMIETFGLHTDYERDALELLQKRADMGGTLGDRKLFLAAMILLGHRRIDKDAVLEAYDSRFVKWVEKHGGRGPKPVELPWYVFDKHTRVGARALSAFMKTGPTNGMTPEQVWQLWFHQESAQVPGELALYAEPKENPLPWETVWWPKAAGVKLTFGGRTARENARLWRVGMCQKMEELVLWSIEKT